MNDLKKINRIKIVAIITLFIQTAISGEYIFTVGIIQKDTDVKINLSCKDSDLKYAIQIPFEMSTASYKMEYSLKLPSIDTQIRKVEFFINVRGLDINDNNTIP